MTAKFIFEANIAHFEGLISKEKRPSKAGTLEKASCRGKKPGLRSLIANHPQPKKEV